MSSVHLEAKQGAQKSSLSCIDCISVNYSMCSIGLTVVWWLLVLCLQSFLLWTVMVALCGCLLLQFLPFCILSLYSTDFEPLQSLWNCPFVCTSVEHAFCCCFLVMFVASALFWPYFCSDEEAPHCCSSSVSSESSYTAHCAGGSHWHNVQAVLVCPRVEQLPVLWT